jgi:RNA-dependent RNA polymerase
MYVSNGVLGKLYHAALQHEENADALLPAAPTSFVYDPDLEVAGFDKLLDTAEEQYKAYAERLGTLMTYSAEREDEILTNNIRTSWCICGGTISATSRRRTISSPLSTPCMRRWRWLRACRDDDATKMASAWYHVMFHPDRRGKNSFFR